MTMRNTPKKIIAVLALLLVPTLALAAIDDVALFPEDVKIPESSLEGKKIRFYATTTSLSDHDVKGIIRFFTGGEQLGADQPVSVVARKEDTVFIDALLVPGQHEILIRFFPFDAEDDDPSNNIVRKTLRILEDADQDGKPNETDPDDDNDGVADSEDVFPLDRKEQKDTDGDGKGDSKDTDDDNDGVLDEKDCAPLDAVLSKDSDNDLVCDKQDAFPNNPAESKDFDRDGRGNNSDPDADNDGLPKGVDTDDLNLGPRIELSGLPVFPTLKQKVAVGVSEIKDPDGAVKEISAFLKAPNGEEKLLTISPAKKFDLSLDKPGKYELKVSAVDDKGEKREEIFPLRARDPIVYMAGLLVVFLVIALAIFGVITYSHGSRRKTPKAPLKQKVTRRISRSKNSKKRFQ